MGGFHMGFGGSPSAAASVLDAIRSAAQQNQQLQQQRIQQSLKDQMDQANSDFKLRQAGYVPIETPSAAGGSGKVDPSGHATPELARRDFRSDVDPSRIHTDGWGRKYVQPAPVSATGATPQQTYSDLAAALEKGGQPVQGGTIYGPGGQQQEQQAQASLMSAHVPVPDQNRVLTPPGSSQGMYMPTGEEKAATKLQEDLRAEAAKNDAAGEMLPQTLSDALEAKSGLPEGSLRGVKLPKEAIAGTFGKLLTAEKPDPSEKWQYKPEVDDNGKVTLQRYGDQGHQLWNGKSWEMAQPGVAIGPKRKDPNAPAGGPGEADDVKSIADSIISGDQPPTLNGLYRQGAAVRAELARKGFNLTTATMDWQATQKHLATLNGAQQERLRQAISFTSDSLDNIEKLYEEWQQYGAPTGMKVFNRAALKAARNLPGKAGEVATALDAQINDLTSELGTVYKGGNSSTDESLRLAAGNLSGEWNPQTFKRAVGQIRQNLKIRSNSVRNSQAVGVSQGSPYTPPGQTPAPAQPQTQGAAPQGVQVKDPTGKIHTFPNQASADAFKKAAGIQ